MRRDRRPLADCYWAAFALLLCSATAMAAENWVKLTPLADNAGTLYLDKDSIERNNDGTVRATSRDAYDTPRKLADGEPYQYDSRTSVYDCTNERVLPVSALIQDTGEQQAEFSVRARYLVGAELLDLRMYRNLAALWEGWTKNWFLGLDRSLVRAFGRERVHWAMMMGAFLVGIPLFFEIGFFGFGVGLYTFWGMLEYILYGVGFVSLLVAMWLALRAKAHGILHRALHRTTEHNALLELLSNRVSDQLSIYFRFANLFNIDVNGNAHALLQFLAEHFNVLALFTNHHTWT